MMKSRAARADGFGRFGCAAAYFFADTPRCNADVALAALTNTVKEKKEEKKSLLGDGPTDNDALLDLVAHTMKVKGGMQVEIRNARSLRRMLVVEPAAPAGAGGTRAVAHIAVAAIGALGHFHNLFDHRDSKDADAAEIALLGL